MALPAAERARTGEVRMALLELHKLLLDRERGLYERDHGAIESPGRFLALAIEDPQFAWLRELSGVIVEMDELLSIRTKGGVEEANAAIERAQALLRLQEEGTEFATRYYAAVQDAPDVVIAHCKLERLFAAGV